MKSSYELAMERLAKSAPVPTLTDAQKKALAEIDSRYQAKLAERETFLQSLLAKAEAADNLQEMAELRVQIKRDLKSIREEWDAKKEQIWQAK